MKKIDIVKPALKYPGGKRHLLSTISKIYEPFRKEQFTFIDAFTGSGIVALNINAPITIMNDINKQVINLHKWIKHGFIYRSLENDEKVFYAARDRYNELVAAGGNTCEEANLLIYLNRHCFNGLMRVNKNGEFNVPYGFYKKVPTVNTESLEKHYRSLTPLNRDFENLPIPPGTKNFIYCDPPYDMSFDSYTKDGFSWYDQVSLATWAARSKSPVLLSNAYTSRIKKLYTELGFKCLLMDSPRSLSCDGNRETVLEVVAANKSLVSLHKSLTQAAKKTA